MRGSTTTDKRTPGAGNIINLVNVKEMAELAGHWSFLSSRRSRQDMSQGVPECGMPATVAAERHDLQTKAKTIACGSSRHCRMLRRISAGRPDQLGLV